MDSLSLIKSVIRRPSMNASDDSTTSTSTSGVLVENATFQGDRTETLRNQIESEDVKVFQTADRPPVSPIPCAVATLKEMVNIEKEVQRGTEIGEHFKKIESYIGTMKEKQKTPLIPRTTGDDVLTDAEIALQWKPTFRMFAEKILEKNRYDRAVQIFYPTEMDKTHRDEFAKLGFPSSPYYPVIACDFAIDEATRKFFLSKGWEGTDEDLP